MKTSIKTSLQTSLKEAAATLTEGLESVIDSSKAMRENLSEYFASDDYEADLDEVISILYMLKPSQARNFEAIRNRQLRVGMKMKFVFSQSKLLLGASAAIGAKVGLSVGGPKGAISGATLGTASGALAITFVAGRVLIRRLSAEGNVVQSL